MWDIDRLLANLPCTNKAPPLSETLVEPFSSLVVEVDDGVLSSQDGYPRQKQFG